MPGFGAAVRAVVFGGAIAFIAALVGRITDPLIDQMQQSPVFDGSPPKGASLALEFVSAANDNWLLVGVLSVLIYFLAKSFANSQVKV